MRFKSITATLIFFRMRIKSNKRVTFRVKAYIYFNSNFNNSRPPNSTCFTIPTFPRHLFLPFTNKTRVRSRVASHRTQLKAARWDVVSTGGRETDSGLVRERKSGSSDTRKASSINYLSQEHRRQSTQPLKPSPQPLSKLTLHRRNPRFV